MDARATPEPKADGGHVKSTPPKAPASRRGTILFAVKLIVAVVLIGWLIRSHALDFAALDVFLKRPVLLALDLGLFTLGVFASVFRYRALLSLLSVKVPVRKLLPLQLTAMFFNVVIPGSVGGDVVKALYVARDEKPEKRTSLLLIAFVERILGLASLIALAAVVAIVRGPVLWGDPLLRPMAFAVIALGAVTLVGSIAFLLLIRSAGARLDVWTSGPSKLSKILNQLVGAARLLASGPKQLLIALFISMVMHAGSMAFFTLLTAVITGQEVSYSMVATIYPLGILSMALPISPAGLGVAHVAFDRLFTAIGLTGGATVFNVFLLGQIAPTLVGVVPYLTLKRRGDLPTT
jgi:uncharacterized protein (TIRG00374 family)